jgi:hypothetical protein
MAFFTPASNNTGENTNMKHSIRKQKMKYNFSRYFGKHYNI